KGWDERWEEFGNWAEKGQAIKDELLKLVDEDTHSFNLIMQAMALPKSTEDEKAVRKNEIQKATKYAIEVPFNVMQLSFDSMTVIKAMAEQGNPNSVTDACVGALCARTAVLGAFMNVKINASGYDDKTFVNEILSKGKEIEKKAIALEAEIINITDGKIGN
ncbi:MAG TPA: cyclodeaminase/cyclohydrolase family protein, partial [Chitinophagaceae bacterium]|nr:cyclodeaminase/cyclohydrolase family protein [Chitinophagaceae bacterium]